MGSAACCRSSISPTRCSRSAALPCRWKPGHDDHGRPSRKRRTGAGGDLWRADAGSLEASTVNRWLAANCFGDYYTRTGLSDAQREMITFCLLMLRADASLRWSAMCGRTCVWATTARSSSRSSRSSSRTWASRAASTPSAASTRRRAVIGQGAFAALSSGIAGLPSHADTRSDLERVSVGRGPFLMPGASDGCAG